MISHANSHAVRARRNRPDCRQHFLKSLPRTAWARIIAAQLFNQLNLAAAHKAQPALHLRFGWIAFTPLTGDLESMAGWRMCLGFS
jgi:hypothetical protein